MVPFPVPPLPGETSPPCLAAGEDLQIHPPALPCSTLHDIEIVSFSTGENCVPLDALLLAEAPVPLGIVMNRGANLPWPSWLHVT